MSDNDPKIFDSKAEEWVPLPFKWAICSSCEGHGKSSAYLGAFTGDQMREDPDFARDYMEGFYDRSCDCCGGGGKVKIADASRMTRAQKKAWREELADRADQWAAERAKYRMTAEWAAEVRS